MAPIAKENELLTPAAESVRPTAPAADARTQAVALELPVTINGARSVDGSDKREPFSETTKTVLVFGNGAVIRLQSPVAPGQLLFLTNEKTKKEVVCQVVKSKNHRNVSGYVELEFTEPVVGFWGMRFPSDRIGTPAPEPPVTAPPKKTPAPVSAKPDAAANFNALKALASSSSESPSIALASCEPPAAAKPAPSPNAPAPVVAKTPAESESESEALKLRAARLQQQLGSLAFTGKAHAKVVELTRPEKSKTAVEPPAHDARPLKPLGPEGGSSSKSMLEADEVKIPSWLEPLARNAAAASAAEPPLVPVVKEEKRTTELPTLASSLVAEPLADSAPPAIEPDTRPFSPTFLVEDEAPSLTATADRARAFWSEPSLPAFSS